jgi:3-methyladenine DNA glycosylase AlkC
VEGNGKLDAPGFVAAATQGLEALELKARVLQVCAALEATLPGDFDRAAGLIEAALAPAEPGERTGALGITDAGLAGWFLWPVGEFIARRGLAHPERALAALHALTQRFTAEFAIRPFIAAHADPSPHVRRLVSEGSRPRLPWGAQLRALIADPSPTLPLLQALQDDPSDYVRRSVANHLNDIAKDHPQLVAQWLETHLPEAPAPRRALLRHASRTLIKRGDPRVLAAWGLGRPLRGTVAWAVSPRTLAWGGSLKLELSLTSTARQAQPLVVDYAVHHVKADGSTRPKVFKGWKLTLEPGQSVSLVKQHSMREITTRRYHPGAHQVDLRVNGQVLAEAGFRLAAPRPTRTPASPGSCP